MDRLKLRKLKLKDLYEISIRANEEKLMGAVDSERIAQAVQMGPAYTARNGDKIIACAGVSLLWPHVGEAWLQTCPEITQYKFWFFRTLAKILKMIIAKYKLHRVQADVDATFESSKRMMRLLGFQVESVMRHYGPNKEDFVRYTFLAGGGNAQ